MSYTDQSDNCWGHIFMFWRKDKEQPPKNLVPLDFITTFPHKYWVSDWTKDESYPEGFRYKILSLRNNEKDMIHIVLLLEESNGVKTEMERMELPPSAAERMCAVFEDGLSKEYCIQFQELDLSAVGSSDELARKVTEAGWYEREP
jgi:hypothetical protein